MIQIGACSLEGLPRNTPTAKSILSAWTFEGDARSSGDEVYFYAPIAVVLESEGKEVVEKGEIAFWVQGNALAIGFGATPRIARGGNLASSAYQHRDGCSGRGCAIAIRAAGYASLHLSRCGLGYELD